MAIRRESLHAPVSGCHRRDLSRSAGPAYITVLVSQAHRLARRRALLETACAEPDAERGAGRPLSDARRRRLAERGARLMVAFHAVLDRLFAADRFEEALEAFRAYRSARDQPKDAAAAGSAPTNAATEANQGVGRPPSQW